MIVFRMNNKVVRTVKILTYFLLLFSVVTKLFCIPYISHKFGILGIANLCELFGLIELIAICFFLYDKTLGFGLVLLCSYFGGAIATDLHSPEYLYQPMVIITLVIITSFIRNPAIFHHSLEIREENSTKTVILKD